MNYTVVLDSKNSYLIENETGLTFNQACDFIIEYCAEAGYKLQQELWEVNKNTGSQSPILFA